ncbi:hypothetical protein [Methylobacterium gnaphalii]|uniref:Uncharacterized protein n=1 Tax=Methylobacterium gnaphalii TaxID=1010610 RepID=A0A512JP78_9HYPH|nr:hypothetical protein [Methylobacterium gnaphalii]GEP11765.1 hypothetical protein MGN01_36100 [Methylobacterium gnaphalii]GJD69441.1 hypothetical protein MMMDOFMJ_2372 [Methylobacterium gnaphalii]GLS49600.1 hypothetical protein GCM10007885_24490 [Methylobacterium gnaphalii]
MGQPAHKLTEAETIADSYLALAQGNPSVALRLVVRDALQDLATVEKALDQRNRLISRGFLRVNLVSA